MRFSSKIAPALNVSDMRPNVLYCFDEGSAVSEAAFINRRLFARRTRFKNKVTTNV